MTDYKKIDYHFLQEKQYVAAKYVKPRHATACLKFQHTTTISFLLNLKLIST